MAKINKIWHYFEIAAEQAFSKKDRRSFYLGAVGIRSDGAIVSACNGPTSEPERKAHAEYRLAKKLDPGSIVFVCRLLRKDRSFAIAKPCHSCTKMLVSRGVSKVYYTIAPGEYGVLNLR